MKTSIRRASRHIEPLAQEAAGSAAAATGTSPIRYCDTHVGCNFI